MTDKLTEKDVTFSKVAAGQGGELPGASITVSGQDVDGNNFSQNWISTGTAKVLKLKAGEYKMTESAAPLGYDTAAEITFRVNKDGIVEVKQGNGWVNAVDAKIQMVDELKSNKVKFSKVAAGQGTELAGAKLTVKRADDTVVETWDSTGTAKEISLLAGEYKMIEDQAPLGYDKAETIEFKVELDGSVKIKQGNSWVAANEEASVGNNVSSVTGSSVSAPQDVFIPTVDTNYNVGYDPENDGMAQIVINPADPDADYALIDEAGNVLKYPGSDNGWTCAPAWPSACCNRRPPTPSSRRSTK